jgi:hypothetical protein
MVLLFRMAVTTIIAACIIGVAARFFFPEAFGQNRTTTMPTSKAIGVAVWCGAIGVGLLEGLLAGRRSRKKEHK